MAGFTVRVTIGFMVRPSRLVRAQLKVGTTVRREQPPAPRQLPVLPHFRCSSRPRDQGKALRCLALPTSRTALVSNRQQARNRPRTSFSLNGITVLVLLYLHRKCGRTQNLAEALETTFTAHAEGLRAVERARHREAVADGGPVPVAPSPPPARAAALAAERRERRVARHRRVWALHREGWPGHAIARHLGLGRSTVVRYLRHETFPEREGRGDAGRSLLDPWKRLLLERWNAGRRLFGELQGLGYRGSYATLARYTQRLRRAQEETAPGRSSRKRPVLPPVVDAPRRPLTPRTAAWLALRRPERRDADGAERLARLRERDPELAEAVGLAEEFAGLLRAREPGRLGPWLARARGGPLPAFRGFAARLGTDEAAVRAAATLPWSTGPVEGQINRLKTLKRQMCGRAKLDLLGRRFLLAA